MVVDLVDGLGGSQLKDRQYLLRDYADTPWGKHIAPITEQARARLLELQKMRGSKTTGETNREAS
ncbi:hypothetical protein [Nocardia salmonicida]|uniref:hypothetical protein n=1 Tax=Nocardia salmonicida TaxID=53431 RepID=UPI00342439FE